MATRDLIRDIVEKGQAGIADPANAIEANEAVAGATIDACYALGELLDDLIRRVARLELQGATPSDLGSQLDGIREELLTLEKSVKKSTKRQKRKRKRKAQDEDD
jgi:hypothetical protein